MMRIGLALVLGGVVATSGAAQPLPIPKTGQAVPRFAEVDDLLIKTMAALDATSATVAISKDSELLYTRGYGWRDATKKQPTPPDALFRIASISKPITAAAIREAERRKLLKLDDLMVKYLKAPLIPNKLPDERLKQVTISHLLTHQGGWDREASFDPMFRADQAAKELQLQRSLTPRDMVVWMMRRPLDFPPGEREAYSNFGYCVLGRVLESVNKKSYYDTVNDWILKPNGWTGIKLGFTNKFDPREVRYNYPPANRFNLDIMDAHGGLIASATALVKFADKFYVTGVPRPTPSDGYGVYFGSLPGTTAMLRQHPQGWNVAVLFNSRRENSIRDDQTRLREQFDAVLERMK